MAGIAVSYLGLSSLMISGRTRTRYLLSLHCTLRQFLGRGSVVLVSLAIVAESNGALLGL